MCTSTLAVELLCTLHALLPVQGQAPPLEPNLAAFELPESVKVSAERHIQRRRPSAEEIERSVAYMRDMISRSRQPSEAIIRVNTSEEYALPVLLNWLPEEDRDEKAREEHVRGGEGAYYFRKDGRGGNGLETFEELYVDSGSSIYVLGSDGVRVQTSMSLAGGGDDGPLYDSRGARLDLLRLGVQTDFILTEAEAQIVDDRVWAATLRFEDETLLRELSRRYAPPPSGMYDYPGEVRLRYTEGEELSIRWIDLDGGLLEENAVKWDASSGRVEARHSRIYLPGTSFVLLRSDVLFSYGDIVEVPKWSPRPHERIFDHRFGATVMQEADADGRILDGFDVALRAKVAIERGAPSRRDDMPASIVRAGDDGRAGAQASATDRRGASSRFKSSSRWIAAVLGGLALLVLKTRGAGSGPMKARYATLVACVPLAIVLSFEKLTSSSGTQQGKLAAPLVAEPELLRLGVQRTGSTVPIRFTLRNAGDDAVDLLQPRPDCGCLDVRITGSTLAPGQSTHLVGRISIKSGEESLQKIAVPFSRDGTRDLVVLRVSYTGDTARTMVVPASLHLGKATELGEGRIAGEFLYLVPPESADDPVTLDAALNGDFTCHAVANLPGPNGGGVLRFELDGWRTEEYGLLTSPVELTFLDSRRVLVAEVSVNRVPTGMPYEDWPDCRMIVSAEASDHSATLEFKHLRNPRILPATDERGLLDCSLGRTDEGHVLAVRVADGAGLAQGEIHEAVLRIQDDERVFSVRVLIVS